MNPTVSRFRRIIQAGLFSACAATVISGIYAYFLWGFGSKHPLGHVYQIPAGVFIGSAETFIPAGSFGFAFGIIGASLLHFLARWIKSLLLLASTSVIIGTVLSLTSPFIAVHILGFGSSFEPLMNWGSFLFAAAVGVPVSFLYAILFRRALLA
jgi:hypothetical protein